MEIRKIKENDYEKYIKGVKNSNFFQSVEWAKFKSQSEWKMDLVGFYEDKKLVGVSSLLSRNLPLIKKKMFYAPRGFVTDYSDFDMLKKITVDYDVDNYSYMEIPKEVLNANKIDLIILIRGVKYTINLK